MSRNKLLGITLSFWIIVTSTCLQAWSPGTGDPNAIQGFTVDTTDRTDVLAFYNTVYFASDDFASDMDWTGNITGVQTNPTGDTAGTTTATFKSDVQRRVNFYRALVGLPAGITFADANSEKDQEAALMFSAEGNISHTPPSNWPDYTANAATAAGHSNIAIGYYGPLAMDAYMIDSGTNNTEVGHRRWMLYTPASVMGTGDVPPNGSAEASNALWFDGTIVTYNPQFNKWPNAGYCPLPLMPARWSVSCPGADFTHATVTMTQGGSNVPCTIIYSDNLQVSGNSFIGDDTLVWEPSNLPTSLSGDTTYTVTVSGIQQAGGTTSITYNVTLFDPNVLGNSVTITGTSSPPSSGATYAFNAIDQADAYDLQVFTANTAPWTEGAETSPTPQVTADTTGSYSIFQSAVKRTGAQAFQLAFPTDVDGKGMSQSYDFSDQSFEITRQIIPTASSQLQFYDLCHFVTTTSTLSAQVSTNNGISWTSVWSRNGTVPNNGNSSNWDPAFIQNNVSLSAYAGQEILVRFVLTGNLSVTGNVVFLGTDSSDGFFLDDITVTNAMQLANVTHTSLPGNATSFMLGSATAGVALQPGTTYYMSIRPEVGLTWYSYGAISSVIPTNSSVTGYSSWISSQYASVTGGPAGDDSGDGIANGVKYAFGVSPIVHNQGSVIPFPQQSGSNLTLSYAFNEPGVTYGAESSTDLVTWTPITDTGSGGTHTFTVSLTGHPHIFIRNKIIVAP